MDAFEWPSARAWEEASITSESAPPSRIRASRAWSSGDSGVVTVVRAPSTVTLPTDLIGKRQEVVSATLQKLHLLPEIRQEFHESVESGVARAGPDWRVRLG